MFAGDAGLTFQPLEDTVEVEVGYHIRAARHRAEAERHARLERRALRCARRFQRTGSGGAPVHHHSHRDDRQKDAPTTNDRRRPRDPSSRSDRHPLSR